MVDDPLFELYLLRMSDPKYISWLAEVKEKLEVLDAPLWRRAAQFSVLSPDEILEVLRGDEPWEVCRTGESAEEYATSLLEEWRLYGPEGE